MSEREQTTPPQDAPRLPIRVTALDDEALFVCHHLRIEGRVELSGSRFSEGTGFTGCFFTEGSGVDVLAGAEFCLRSAVVRPTRELLAEWISAGSLEAQGYQVVDEVPAPPGLLSAAVLPRYLHIADVLLKRFDIRVAVSDSQETPE